MLGAWTGRRQGVLQHKEIGSAGKRLAGEVAAGVPHVHNVHIVGAIYRDSASARVCTGGRVVAVDSSDNVYAVGYRQDLV